MSASTKEQLPLWDRYRADGAKAELRDAAAADNKTQPIHRWVPWIAGFSAQFAADAIEAYLPARGRAEALVLDPFAGVGTTLIEALKAGANTVGFDINPFAVLSSRAKVGCIDVPASSFRIEVNAFREAMLRLESDVDAHFAAGDTEALAAMNTDLALVRPLRFKSRIPFFSPPVETKFLYALRRARALLEPDRSLFLAALGATMVSYSNYSYEPSLSSRPGAGKPLIDNASVGLAVCRKLDEMLEDLSWVQGGYSSLWQPRRREVRYSSYLSSELPSGSVSLLVTSPPYMNNYHYVRNTRAQMHWLDLVTGSEHLHRMEHESFGKFWQTVRQAAPIGLSFDFPELKRSIEHLRTLRPEKGYYGGSGWANYVAVYFNDTDRFLRMVRQNLRHGSHALIVVGNSIIQGMEFKVDHLMAQMAERRGLVTTDIRIVRTKRVGNSIIDSSVRNGNGDGAKLRAQLYDAAIILEG